VRQEETPPGTEIKNVADASDFVRLDNPSLWLPRHLRLEWHRLPGGEERYSETPFQFVDITLNSARRTIDPSTPFSLADRPDYRAPRTAVADGRVPGAENAPDGRIAYIVPAQPKDLPATIDRSLANLDTFLAQRASETRRWWLRIGLSLITTGGSVIGATLIIRLGNRRGWFRRVVTR
jgi:hypothetical protein